MARTALRHDHWHTAQAILEATFTPRARVAVKACHASSKTFTAADAVLLALLLGGDVLTTAPTWQQVETVLWGQIHRALSDSAVSAWGTVNQTEIHLPTGEFALGLSTNDAVRFQGFHSRAGRFLLVVMDEAPGVLPGIYEAIEGIRAGGDVRVLAIGNPVIASGPFHDAFTGNRAGWSTFTIDALDTPNLEDETRPGHQLTLEELLALPEDRLGYAPRPYLVDRAWVIEKYHEWGEQSPLWQSRVRGQFPEQGEDALLSLAWLEAAKVRAPLKTAESVTAGLDVAGPGEDETVLAIRRGPNLVAPLQSWSQADPRGKVVDALLPWQTQLESVNVDSAGIGYYMGQHLADVGFPVRLVNVGTVPTDPERYANLKAELYWGLRLRAAAGDFTGLTDDRAISQLAGIRYRHDARGRVVIESKEDARKRGVKSPDRAEAIMLAFAPLPPADLEGVVLYEDAVTIGPRL